MAISRLSDASIQDGLPKFDNLWDGVTAVGSMELIRTTRLTASSSSVEFNNIPGTYSHLQIRGTLRNTVTGTGSLDLHMRFNSDSGSNYRAYKQLSGDGANAVVAASGLTTEIANAHFLKDGNTANIYSAWICDILDYANTNKNKVTRSLNGQDLNGSGHIKFLSGLWINTSAITSIRLTVEGSNNFKEHSSFSLYGIK